MKQFIKQLHQFIDRSRIIDDHFLCYAYGTDASLYRMTPKLVILIENATEVQKLLVLANKLYIPLTFRAAGTSLSGQAITDSVLVVLSNNSWQKYTIYNKGQQISLEPGIIGANANLFLKPYRTKIGPDPASINACKIGGIVANNSSGMCCGIAQNTYQTMYSIKLILANGSMLDTANELSKKTFAQENPVLINGIKNIHRQIHNDPGLVEFIVHKFRIKNTSGYSLNAFIDFNDPVDILAHLMVGSEGTLGFISEITYNCVADNPYKAISLIYCDNLEQIINLSQAFKDITVDAIELLDITSINSVKASIKNPNYLPPNLGHDTSAILIEISANSEIGLNQKISQMQLIINRHQVVHQVQFSSDNRISQELWDMRRGILPAVGGYRPADSTVIIEDIAVSIPDLPLVVTQIRDLLKQHNYTNAAIFGHILAGNIHFIFTPNFNTQAEIDNYNQFMHSIVSTVNTYRGSLKAEHGCGRNMAAFIELEWGKFAYDLMWQIKTLLDPNNILNPDVILSRDPNIHLKNLKQLPTADLIVDKCIECGFCESVCPSRNLTLTPRQRISVYRYINTFKATHKNLYKKFIRQYKYYGIDTCATTGLCANKCPVGIDTGKFILGLKQKPKTLLNSFLAKNFNLFVAFNRHLLTITNFTGRLFGKNNTYQISRSIHKVIPIMPIYPTSMPQTQDAVFKPTAVIQGDNKQKIMYIPSCNNRIFADNNNIGDRNAVHHLLEHIGYTIIYPEYLANLCCGQIFDSVDTPKLRLGKKNQLNKIIINSRLPVLIDNSSCFHNTLQSTHGQLTSILDIIETNLGKLCIKNKYHKIALHIDCSSIKLGQSEKIIKLLTNFASEIIIPYNINCCGFAGRIGFTTPELNESALSSLADQIKECEIGVTFNRNCQIGLSLHGQKQYLSLAELVLTCL
ncbi:MAG: hypothetical protein K0R14_1472 [Burkholderiales bacterium]|jgi:D-lactate dehydrogenase|nr:hypothetical protein [Burkholderiales bacterium]